MNGSLFVLFAAILWGTTGTSQALAPVGATPLAIGAVRLVVGGFTLLAIALLRNGFTGPKMPIRASLTGGVFVALYQVSFFLAVKITGVAIGTIVAIGSSPVFAGLFAFWATGEQLDKRWYAATAMAVAGCTLLSLSGETVTANPVGIACAFGAGLSYAGYTTASKVMLDGRNPDGVMAVIFSMGAVLLAPILLFVDLSWLGSASGVGVALHLGFTTIALSYWLFARGLAKVKVGTAATLSLAEPFTAALLGVLLLGEHISFIGSIGAVLVFLGLSVLAVPSRLPKQNPKT